MKIEIVTAPLPYPLQYREINGVRVWLVGRLHTGDDSCAALHRALTYQGKLLAQEQLRARLRDMRGNFAFIVQDRDRAIVAAVDKIRSYPIFYFQVNDILYVGSDPYEIKTRLPHITRDQNAFLEFKMAGYVTGGDSLFKEIKQLQAGAFLMWDGKDLRVRDYYTFYNPTTSGKSRDGLIDELHQTTRRIFKKMIERLNGRPAWVPLSGGLDSRLVLCMLKELDYDRIQTFSYGIPGNCEAAAAQAIAQKINVPWFSIPYTRAFGRRAFYTKEREAYFHFAHALSGIPMMTDFYALYALSLEGRISKDAVIINGQTGDFISGEHIPAALNHPEITQDGFLNAIIAKHYALWRNLHTPENVITIKQRIMRMLQASLPRAFIREDAMKRYEMWEWRARQAQHVVAGQRAYDFFGIAWELPLWDDEYLNFWSQIPFEHKFRQSLYHAYVETHDPFGVFRMKFRRYTPPRWAHWLENAFVVFGSRQDEYRRLYLKYWQKYAYFYAKDSYRTYQHYARYHRNPSSVLAKDVLEREYGELVL